MRLLTAAKDIANAALRFVNMRVESLTAERAEANRLRELESANHFEKPIFPVLGQFAASDPSPILQQIERSETRFAEVVDPTKPNAFPLKNDYFTTPDAEVLYAIVQLYRPSRIVEVGSGYSTQLFRMAIDDAGLKTNLVSIDPQPRQDIGRYSDRVIKERAEKFKGLTLFAELRSKDILFIDSSHEIKLGNDLLHIVFDILPVLASGVLVHFHDIFLPYEYPRVWIVGNKWNWTEQYLVQALLQGSNEFEVIWPGYYLQKTRSNFANAFGYWNNSTARSLWLRKATRDVGE